MKKYLSFLIGSGILLFAPLLTYGHFCPCLGNWYIAGSGSATWHNHQRFSFAMDNDDFSFSRRYKMGWGGNCAIGYLIRGLECVNLRVEGEFVYRNHKLYKGNFTRYKGNKRYSKNYNLHGHAKDSAAMANLIADLPFPFACCMNFYFGLGVGASFNRSTMKPSHNYEVKPPFSRNSWLVAAQLLAGLSYQWTECTVLTLGYRLFSTGEVLTERNLLKSDNRPYIQSVELGIRFQL